MACKTKQNDWNFFRAEKVRQYYPLSELQIDKAVPGYCDDTTEGFIIQETGDYIFQEDSYKIELQNG